MVRECYEEILRWVEDSKGKALCIKGGVMSGKTYILKELVKCDKFSKVCILDCSKENFIKFRMFYNYHLIKTKDKGKALVATLKELTFGFSNTRNAILLIDDLDSNYSPYFDNALSILKCKIAYTVSTISFSQKGYVGIFPNKSITLEGYTFKEFVSNKGLEREYTKATYKLNEPSDSLIEKLFTFYFSRGSLITVYKEESEDVDYKKLYKEYVQALEKDILRLDKVDCDVFTIKSILISIAQYTGKARCSTTAQGTLVDYCMNTAVASKDLVLQVLNYLEANKIIIPSSNCCNENQSTYSRFYFKDWGLAIYLLDYNNNYAGSILESYVAGVLYDYSYKLCYYYSVKNPIELDFVVFDEKGQTIAIEVKSTFTKGKSITRALEDKLVDSGFYVVKAVHSSILVGCNVAMFQKYIEEGRLSKLNKSIYDYEIEDIFRQTSRDINMDELLDNVDCDIKEEILEDNDLSEILEGIYDDAKEEVLKKLDINKTTKSSNVK